jgi:hypothetical protein
MRVFTISGLACVAVFVAGVAPADPLPHEKLGLWLQDATTMGQHVSGQYCIDATTEARMSVFSSSMAHNGKCQRGAIVHEADGSWTNESTCEFRPGVKKATRAVISGDFNSKFTMALTSVPDGASIVNMTATWTGPCKPGMKGGDVIMSNGMKINLLDGTSSGQPGAAPR